MQQQTPEQVENQKIDMKLNELQHKRALQDNPELQSPTDALYEMLMPKKPKVKPAPQMKVLSNNGELIGDGKVAKGQKGMAAPYNTAVLNAHRPKGATDAVARYQAMMNAKYGLSLAVDGAWGRATQEAYEKYVLPEQNAQQIHQQALKLSDGSKPSALPFNNTGGVQPPMVPVQRPYTSGGAPSAGVTAQPGWGVR